MYGRTFKKVCFKCRRVFGEHPFTYGNHPGFEWPYKERGCQHCGGDLVGVGYYFRAPRRRRVKEWKKLELALLTKKLRLPSWY